MKIGIYCEVECFDMKRYLCITVQYKQYCNYVYVANLCENNTLTLNEGLDIGCPVCQVYNSRG